MLESTGPPWLTEAEATLTDQRLDGLVCPRLEVGATVTSWSTTRLPATGGGAFDTVVTRHVRSCQVCARSHSVITKVVARSPVGTRSRDDAAARELHAYREVDWFAGLPTGLEAPKLLDSAVLPSSIVLVLEDMGADNRGSRSIDWYGVLARRIGQFNGTSWPSRRWLSHDHLRSEADRGARRGGQLSTGLHSRIDDVRPALFEALDRTPSVVSHLELFSRNVSPVVGGAEPSIGIFDWATVGWAPIGTDVATLFALTLAYLDVSLDDAEQFEQQIYSGYVTGLADVGHRVDEPMLRANFAAIAALRFGAMMANAGPMADAGSPLVSVTIGQPLDLIRSTWEMLADRFADLAVEAQSTTTKARSSIRGD